MVLITRIPRESDGSQIAPQSGERGVPIVGCQSTVRCHAYQHLAPIDVSCVLQRGESGEAPRGEPLDDADAGGEHGHLSLVDLPAQPQSR